MNNDLTITIPGCKLYVTKGETEINNYVEIGYYDTEGIGIPICALETKKKALDENVDENKIYRVLYNPYDSEDYKSEVIN